MNNPTTIVTRRMPVSTLEVSTTKSPSMEQILGIIIGLILFGLIIAGIVFLIKGKKYNCVTGASGAQPTCNMTYDQKAPYKTLADCQATCGSAPQSIRSFF